MPVQTPTGQRPILQAAACLLGPDRLSAYQITVRQTPKQIRTA